MNYSVWPRSNRNAISSHKSGSTIEKYMGKGWKLYTPLDILKGQEETTVIVL